MKKKIVMLIVFILAGSFAARAIAQNILDGKVVRLSGALSGLGVVVEHEVDNYIILEDVDGSTRLTFNLKNQVYRLDILADSREAYLQLQRDGLVPEETPAAFKPSPSVSAFPYLSDLAARARKMRRSSGTKNLITGIVASGLGIVFLAAGNDSETTKAGTYVLVGGLLVVGLGIYDLSVKSGPERKYSHAQKLTLAERDTYCADVLATESKKAQIGRFLKAGLGIGLAVVCLAAKPLPVTDNFIYKDFDWNIYGAITFGFIGVANLFFPSYEERVYHRYQNEKAAAERNNRLAWNIGMIPRGFALAV